MASHERQQQRRDQLIEAAIAVYGERGYRSATVKAVCEAAGLTERYFYESFSGSEALLVACYEMVNAQLFEVLAAAALAAGGDAQSRARALLKAYFQALREQPQSARVFLLEIRGVSAAMDETFERALEQIGAAATLVVAGDAAKPPAWLQTAVIGGVVHLASRWVREDFTAPLADVVDAALALGMLLAEPPRASGGPPTGTSGDKDSPPSH